MIYQIELSGGHFHISLLYGDRTGFEYQLLKKEGRAALLILGKSLSRITVACTRLPTDLFINEAID